MNDRPVVLELFQFREFFDIHDRTTRPFLRKQIEQTIERGKNRPAFAQIFGEIFEPGLPAKFINVKKGAHNEGAYDGEGNNNPHGPNIERYEAMGKRLQGTAEGRYFSVHRLKRF